MDKLKFIRIDENQERSEVPSKFGKKAAVYRLKESSGKHIFIIKNGNYSSNSYLKNKVSNLIRTEFPNQIIDISLAAFNSGDKIYSDPLPEDKKGTKFLIGPDFRNYWINGIVECGAKTVRRQVYIFFEDNISTTCRGGGTGTYSKCIVQ